MMGEKEGLIKRAMPDTGMRVVKILIIQKAESHKRID